MSLININDKLILFGGSGHSALCYNDIHIYDPEKNIWLAVNSKFFEGEESQPHPRAGRTCNIAGTKLYIIGGSYGPNYLRDVSIIETDPPPIFERKTKENSPEFLLRAGLSRAMNDPQFSDVTFIVEGKKFYAHKVILSLISDHFRQMFKSGM